MNNESQNIIAYLLGALPEDEAARFDEASLTDDDFAERLTAAENDLIDGYLQDELTGENLKKFESFYLASPLRREKVEFAKSLQIVAERRRTAPGTEAERAGFFSWVKNYHLQFGLACAALLVIVLGAFFFNARRAAPEIVSENSPAPSNQTNTEIVGASPKADPTQNQEPTNQNTNNPQTNKTSNNTTNSSKNPVAASPSPKITLASFVLAPPVRSNNIRNFVISKETTEVAVRLELESNDFPAYQVTLTDETGNNLRRFASLRARGNSLNVRLPAKLLTSGVYSFVVAGIKDGEAEIISNYTFRAVVR